MKQSVKLRKDVANLTVSTAAHEGKVTGVEATADGLTTGTIADNLAEMSEVIDVDGVTGQVNHWITLPTPTPGKKLLLLGGGFQYELRSSTPATVKINGVGVANNELAVAASQALECICYNATNWVVTNAGYGVAGA